MFHELILETCYKDNNRDVRINEKQELIRQIEAELEITAANLPYQASSKSAINPMGFCERQTMVQVKKNYNNLPN